MARTDYTLATPPAFAGDPLGGGVVSGPGRLITLESGDSVSSLAPATGEDDGAQLYHPDYPGILWVKITDSTGTPIQGWVSSCVVPTTPTSDGSYSIAGNVQHYSQIAHAAKAYVGSVAFFNRVITTNDGSNYWGMSFDNDSTQLATYDTYGAGGQNQTAGTWYKNAACVKTVDKIVTVAADPASAELGLKSALTKTGSPGNINVLTNPEIRMVLHAA